MFTMINLFSLLALSFLTSQAKAQQNYSKNSALDCNASDETGPSSPFPYSCNGQSQSCQAFLIFKSQPSLHSVPAISVLTSANEEELARINYVTRLSEFPTNKEVIVPVNCSCFGQYYQANTTIQATTTRGTYYVIANDTYMRDYLLALRLSAGIHMPSLSLQLSSSSLATREETLVTESCRERKLVVREDLRAKIASYEQVLKVFEFEKSCKRCNKENKCCLDKTCCGDYLAPEYVGVGQVTPKIDVYAFGVILLEPITGKDAVFTQDGKESLLSTAIVSIMERENPEAELDFYVDPGLKGICGTDFVLCLTKVSVACLMKEPVRRPNMEEVVSILLKIQANVLKS
ncbi:hypothetical protein NC653_006371 [Populus alba x Populus x berolinensis]|uniref:NFP/LYK4/5 first LysM domain-containing protein n=2 Tax=Populus TaxID=3689 RepID=A0A4U5PX00_POPAL|nr:hypothetical protein NC653_006371 [Populus alba x Populus x berolinensis]TKS01452.1 hypothetical protein D5086_0000172650 [Populus alba]